MSSPAVFGDAASPLPVDSFAASTEDGANPDIAHRMMRGTCAELLSHYFA
jgi:hypothetical protein